MIADATEAETMDRIRSEMAPHLDGTPRGTTDFAGQGTRRAGQVVGRSAAYRSIAMHPAVLAAGNHVLASAQSWNLSSVGYFELFPDEPKQLLHRDIWKYGVARLPVEVDLNGMWAVNDFTADNGATHVIPGSHLWDEDRRPEPDDSRPAEMTRGSLLLYTGKMFHGGGANVSDGVRIGLSVQHSAGWLTQTEQLMVECPPEVVASWDDALVRFLGYQRRGPAVGYYGNNEDPMTPVENERLRRLANKER